MNVSSVNCTRCGALMEVEAGVRLEHVCPGCGADIVTVAFPVLFRGIQTPRQAERIVSDEHAGCFYHPDKTVAVPCDLCGRFLCDLCDVRMGSRHLCPSCIASAVGDGKEASLTNSYFAWDSLAWRLAVWPLAVTPIIALYLALRHWKSPTGPFARTRVRWIVAATLGPIQIIAWVWVFLDLFGLA